MKPRMFQRSLLRPFSRPTLLVRALHRLQTIGVPFPARQNIHTFQGENVKYLPAIVDRGTAGYSAQYTGLVIVTGELKYTRVRNQGGWVVFGDHREGRVRLDRARLVCPYRDHRSSHLMDLECTKKVKYFKGTGLLKRQNANLSVSVHERGAFHRDSPKFRCHVDRLGSRVLW